MSTNQPSGSILSTSEPIHAIVIADSKVSNWYFQRIKPSWVDRGYSVFPINAHTPQSIEHRTELRFDINRSIKYTLNNVVKQFTPTEKAVWYSHYDRWVRAIELNKPITVIEHDAVLVKPNNLRPTHDLTFYDCATMGAYTITPQFAQFLVDQLRTLKVDCGPYAFIDFVHRLLKLRPDLTLRMNNDTGPFKWAVKQIVNHMIGTTIDHHSNVPSPLREKFRDKEMSNGSVIHLHERVNFSEKHPDVPSSIQ